MFIASKIRKQLEQPNGLTQEALEPMAAEYSQLAGQVNTRLAECVAFLRKGLRSEALQRATMKPGVLELAAELDFQELEEWIEILQFYGIEPPQLVDRDAAAQLHEAFVEEQPLEELLRQHRRLAIAKAPLGWRLKVLRQIAAADPLNLVWTEDIQQWETIRLKQISSEWTRLAGMPESSEELRRLSEELHGNWLVPPSKELKQKIKAECDRRAFQAQIQQLKSIADKLHDVYLASDMEAGRVALESWKSSVASLKQPVPSELNDEVAPAIEWVQDRMREAALSERQAMFSAKLEQLLQSNSTNEGELTRAYHDVIGCDLGIDTLLENRFQTRLSELQMSSQRRLLISVISIVAAAIALMVGGGLWYWNHNYRLAVANTTSQLQSLLDREDHAEAESILKTLESQAPSIATAPEVASLKSTLLARQAEEATRAEQVAALIKRADSETPEELDVNWIQMAEKAAKTNSEKQSVARIRAKFDQYQQKLANEEFDQLRGELQGLESRLQNMQRLPMAQVNDAEIEGLISEVKGLLQRYPRAVAQASKLVELTQQRAIASRDALRKERREMEQKQVYMVGIRGATSLQEHTSQARKFVEALPNDSMASEFKDALNEAALWKSVEDWNAWCNQLSLHLSNRLNSDDNGRLAASCRELRAMIEGLPGEELVPAFQSRMSAIDNREGILEKLAEELLDSVIIDLYTLRKPNSEGGFERAFVQFEASTEIESDLKRANDRTRSTIPIVSDPTGGVKNEEFIGKVEVIEEPRQSIRILVRDLKTQKAKISADWENQMQNVLARIAQFPNVDGKIKEVLFSRVLSAAREGSVGMKDAFHDLQEMLFRTSEKRNRWYGLGKFQEGLDPELVKLYQDGKGILDSRSKDEASKLQNLSKARVVWVGAILRDGKGAVAPSFYRDDVPDGTLHTVVADPARADRGKLVRVGDVRERVGTLKASPDVLLPGRPLFWMRTVSGGQ